MQEKIFNSRKSFCDFIEKKTTYIDSNILMDNKYKYLFDYFKNYKLNIILSKIQYDEIYNLKQSSQNDKAYKARQAFRIIEEQLNLNNLIIEELGTENYDNAYADNEFIESISNKIDDKQCIVFISEDSDLRIRIKNNEKVSLSNNIYIYNSKNLEFLNTITPEEGVNNINDAYDNTKEDLKNGFNEIYDNPGKSLFNFLVKVITPTRKY